MRLFLAFALPEDLEAVLQELQERGRRAGWAAAWPRPETMHLTLAFLGDVPPEVLPHLERMLPRVVAHVPPMDLRTGPLGGFPTATRARVAWLGVDPHPDLWALASNIRSGLASLHLPADNRPFRPHLTFGRLRAPVNLAGLGPSPSPVTFRAEALELFESRLEPHGAQHRRIARFPLGGSAVPAS